MPSFSAPLLRFDSEGRVVWTNAAAQEKGLGTGVLASVGPADRAKIEDAIQAGCARTCEVRIWLDGAAFRLLLHPAGDGHHADAVVLPAVRELESAQVRRKTQRPVSAHPVCLIHLDPSGIVTYESQTACRVLGYSAVGEVFVGADAQLDRAVDYLLADGTSFAALPVQVEGEESTAPLMAYGNPMRNAAGELVGAVLTVADAPTTEQAAYRADAGRGAFVSTVTHEVRNPLGVVNGFATMLSDELDEFAEAAGRDLPEPVAEFVETIQLNARRALDILADLSDLAELEAGALTVRHEPVRLAELIARIARAFVPSRDGPWRVHLDVSEEEDAIVTGDPHRIEQILNALLANAAASAEEATLRLSASGPTAAVAVEADAAAPPSFTDTGKRDPSERYRRAGRGLAIARGLAEAMGGQLSYLTHADGSRAFVLSLPSEKAGD